MVDCKLREELDHGAGAERAADTYRALAPQRGRFPPACFAYPFEARHLWGAVYTLLDEEPHCEQVIQVTACSGCSGSL